MENTLFQFDPRHYGPPVQELWLPDYRMPLEPGDPHLDYFASLQQLTPEKICAPHPVQKSDFARLCIAGLWLYHNFLEEAHSICQGIDSPEGSYWHALMHRREGDFWNSNYWFRRVGSHGLFQPLKQNAVAIARNYQLPTAAGQLLAGERWEPAQFTSLYEEAVRHNETLADFCRAVQQKEWELLFDYCFSRAIGRATDQTSF